MPRLLSILLLSCASLVTVPVRAADPQAEVATAATKNEIKLFIAAKNVAHARELFKLDGLTAVHQTVCFFDTEDRALQEKHLILRARQNDGGPGESTVKIRSFPAGAPVDRQEIAIPPEQDWTRADSPTLSRSLGSAALDARMIPEVLESGKGVIDLFDTQQQALVTGRMGNFDWKSLKRYGPVQAEVWKRQLKLDGFSERVTIEIWHLKKDGVSRDLMEISAKAKADTEIEARAIVKAFFDAANAAGLGQPTGETKTAKVLDFYDPGR